MGQALYRKTRPRKFSDVVGQEHVTKTLANAIKTSRVSHAYLFTGPRGVGKTSVARILAHEVNALPYDGETVHLDIIEIDGASNRRIDEIRDLRDKARVSPAAAKYKVYIIDEVHMLTREAFNALLKTLEEPPAHCIFILATTEYHKLPETIISRTQRFSFKPVDTQSAVKHLEGLAKKEKLDIDREALELLAEHGDGSFRDSISLLDQLSGNGGKITAATVRQTLGLPAASTIDNLVDSLGSSQNTQIMAGLEELRAQGVAPAAVARQLAAKLRASLLGGNNQPWLTQLLKKLLEVPGSSRPQDYLEIALLEAAQHNQPESTSAQELDRKPPTKKPPGEATAVGPAAGKPGGESVAGGSAAGKPPVALSAGHSPSIKASPRDFNLADWPAVIERVKVEAASIYTALRLAEPRLENHKLTLAFRFPLHQKKITQSKNLDLIGRIIEETCGAKVELACEVDKTLSQAAAEPVDKPPTGGREKADPLQSISNIFGAAEVLE